MPLQVLKMLKRKMPIEEISEITGLSDKEIKKYKFTIDMSNLI